MRHDAYSTDVVLTSQRQSWRRSRLNRRSVLRFIVAAHASVALPLVTTGCLAPRSRVIIPEEMEPLPPSGDDLLELETELRARLDWDALESILSAYLGAPLLGETPDALQALSPLGARALTQRATRSVELNLMETAQDLSARFLPLLDSYMAGATLDELSELLDAQIIDEFDTPLLLEVREVSGWWISASEEALVCFAYLMRRLT